MKLAGFVALIVVAAACGGGSDDAGDDVTSPTTTSASQPSGNDQPQTPTSSGDTSGSQTTAPDNPDPTDPPTTDGTTLDEAPELGDTSWLFNDYRMPNGSITNTWIVDVTMEFGTDGTVSGSAGCNDYQGTWTVSGGYAHTGSFDGGQDLVLESLSWTERACDDDRVMTQEAEILEILPQVRAWVFLDGELNLLDADRKYLADAVATGRHLMPATPCEGEPTRIEIGEPVQDELTMGDGWPNSAYFCVEIGDDVSFLTVTVSDMTADLDVFVAYPTFQALRDGSSDWTSINFGTEDEVLIIDSGVADFLAPGSYYIEVASGEGDLGSFTVTATVE